ncbi:hypothetical protein FJD33_21515 [Shewanella sp. LC2]|nr:hypothetical protein FJD33_21515 [Shewanella sp. LC2]
MQQASLNPIETEETNKRCGLWLVACGLWLVACGLWLVACGLWHDKIIDTKKPSFDGLLSSTNVSD